MLFDNLGEFFNQIPLGLIVMVCGSGILLLCAFAWLAYFKPLRNKRRAERQAQREPDYDEMPHPPARTVAPGYDMMDMPDLNMLVDDLHDEPPKRDTNAEPEFLTTPPREMPRTSPPAPQPIIKGKKYRVTLNTGDVIESEELISVMRDPRDRRLVVYHEGTGYRTLVHTPDVKKEFVAIMRELSEVVTQPDENPPEAAPVEPVIANEPPVAEPTLEDIPAPPPKRTMPPPPIGPSGTMPGDLPSFKLDDTKLEPSGKGLFGRPKFDFEAVEELDLGARIEAYLQHKLNYTPEYAGRDIHVRTAPGGGVRIQVDDKFYDAVGDIEDAEVRAFLAETIQEWQDRH